MHITSKIALTGALIAVALSSCNSTNEPTDVSDPVIEPKVITLSADESRAVVSSNEFSEKFFKTACQRVSGNLVTSPFSASMLLGLLSNGADPDAAQEIADVFGFDDLDALNSFYQKMGDYLPFADPSSVNLGSANAIWYDNGNTLSDSFSSAASKYYFADLYRQDLKTPASTVAQDVNNWVKDKTHGLITQFLVPSYAEAIILNALYFDGKWVAPFDPTKTDRADFIGQNKTSKVDMMHQTFRTAYFETEDYQAVEKPFGKYSNNYTRFKATILLPAEGKTCDDLPALSQVGRGPAEVTLSLPKFDTDEMPEVGVGSIFSALGIQKIFSGEGQHFFNENRTLSHSLCQKARLSIDEAGAKAAAVTGDALTDNPPTTFATVTVNHPFVIYITETTTGTILFAARITDL